MKWLICFELHIARPIDITSPSSYCNLPHQLHLHIIRQAMLVMFKIYRVHGCESQCFVKQVKLCHDTLDLPDNHLAELNTAP